MVKVIVAGGTGGIGRTLVNELARGGQHEVTVLSRSPFNLFEQHQNVGLQTVNYEDEAGLARIVEQTGASVVISCLSPPIAQVFEAEKALIRAAAASSSVKRFAPSQFGVDMSSAPDARLPLSWAAGKNEVVAALRDTRLEWTLFINGWFMDYFVQPWVSSHMLPEVPFIDMFAAEASIPGDGEAVVTFTMTEDVARFVRRAVEDEDRWDEQSFIIGDQATMNEILGFAEEARSRKFKVTYNDISQLQKGTMADVDAWRRVYDTILSKEDFLEMFSAFGAAIAFGDLNFERSRSLNAKYPDIETTKLKDVMMRYWTLPYVNK